MSINHDRALDKEMDEAAERASEVTGLEKNPLLIILYRPVSYTHLDVYKRQH